MPQHDDWSHDEDAVRLVQTMPDMALFEDILGAHHVLVVGHRETLQSRYEDSTAVDAIGSYRTLLTTEDLNHVWGADSSAAYGVPCRPLVAHGHALIGDTEEVIDRVPHGIVQWLRDQSSSLVLVRRPAQRDRRTWERWNTWELFPCASVLDQGFAVHATQSAPPIEWQLRTGAVVSVRDLPREIGHVLVIGRGNFLFPVELSVWVNGAYNRPLCMRFLARCESWEIDVIYVQSLFLRFQSYQPLHPVLRALLLEWAERQAHASYTGLTVPVHRSDAVWGAVHGDDLDYLDEQDVLLVQEQLRLVFESSAQHVSQDDDDSYDDDHDGSDDDDYGY